VDAEVRRREHDVDASGSSGATADAVLAERGDDGVLTLTFNRPERRNGWSEILATAYYDRLADADADPSVRAVVVTGAGKTFCPGADFERLQGMTDVVAVERNPAFTTARGFRKPLIAAVNGGCAGVGLVQALFCHVRFAAEGARFSTAFARRGLIAEYGVAWLLGRLVGTGNAMDLLVSARTFDAAEAHRIGLVNRVVPAHELEDAVASLVAKIAPTPAAVLRLTKLALLRAYEAAGLPEAVAANLDISAILNAAETPEQREFDAIVARDGLKAALEWRDSRYGKFAP
jgi:enoyl-CoA hydratase/carnithine racemase